MGGVAEWREPGTMVFTVDELQRIDPGEEVSPKTSNSTI